MSNYNKKRIHAILSPKLRQIRSRKRNRESLWTKLVCVGYINNVVLNKVLHIPMKNKTIYSFIL